MTTDEDIQKRTDEDAAAQRQLAEELRRQVPGSESQLAGLAAGPVKGVVLKVAKQGNSHYLRLTKPVVDALSLAEGDQFFASSDNEGNLRLSPYDPEFEKRLKAYRLIAKRNRQALRELGK